MGDGLKRAFAAAKATQRPDVVVCCGSCGWVGERRHESAGRPCPRCKNPVRVTRELLAEDRK